MSVQLKRKKWFRVKVDYASSSELKYLGQRTNQLNEEQIDCQIDIARGENYAKIKAECVSGFDEISEEKNE